MRNNYCWLLLAQILICASLPIYQGDLPLDKRIWFFKSPGETTATDIKPNTEAGSSSNSIPKVDTDSNAIHIAKPENSEITVNSNTESQAGSSSHAANDENAEENGISATNSYKEKLSLKQKASIMISKSAEALKVKSKAIIKKGEGNKGKIAKVVGKPVVLAAIAIGVLYIVHNMVSNKNSDTKSSTEASSKDSSNSCVPTDTVLCPNGDGKYVDNSGNVYDNKGNLISSASTSCAPTENTLCPSSYNNGTYVDEYNNLYDGQGNIIRGNGTTANSAATSDNSTCVPTETELCPDPDVSGLYYDVWKNIYDNNTYPLYSSVTTLTLTNSSCDFNGSACYIGNGTFLDGYGNFFDSGNLMFSDNNATVVAEKYNLQYTPALSN